MERKKSYEKIPVVCPSLQRTVMAYRPTGLSSTGRTEESGFDGVPSRQTAQGQETRRKSQVYKLSCPSPQRILSPFSPTFSIRSGSVPDAPMML